MKKGTWIISVLVAAVLLTACNRTPPQNPNPPGDDIGVLNSKPQKEYPEFTLEAQKAAMQREDDFRRQTRVEGLRDKVPPADWIEIAYHGLLIDANYDVIEMNDDTISKMQESMFSILYEPAREQTTKRFKGDPKQLFNDDRFQREEKLVLRNAVLNSLLTESDPKLQARYEWRVLLLRREIFARFGLGKLVLAESLIDLLRSRGFLDKWIRFRPPTTSQYFRDCGAQGVPLPPNWPDSRWISQGPLAFVFISATLDAEVFAYKDPSVAGACYALPRRDSAGSISLLGIICESETTGKACFWDNVAADGTRVTGANISLDINTIGNGSNLAENCTACHRGYNVFNIHPGSALDLSRAGAVGGPYDTNPAVRYTPMGQATWSNPGPLVLPAPPSGQSSCLACHELPQTSGSYCTAVLRSAAMNTMPPFGSTRGGWPGTSVAVNPAYSSHITALSACP
ncbi:MAG: hypothetical protein M3R69_11485 [Acidobacteriota bacterium]|nr:hypothetical protein [Acidobacteriota bacterium]